MAILYYSGHGRPPFFGQAKGIFVRNQTMEQEGFTRDCQPGRPFKKERNVCGHFWESAQPGNVHPDLGKMTRKGLHLIC